MRKMLGAAQKSTPRGGSLYPPIAPLSSSVSSSREPSFVVLVRGRCRRRRLPLTFPPLLLLIVFLHFTTATVLRYSDIGIACYSASSLSASFDPLNLAGGRPAISRKLVKSRTYWVKERRTLLHELFQTFLSFPHCLVASFTRANASSKPQYRRLGQQRTRCSRYIVGTRNVSMFLEIYLEDSDKYSSVYVSIFWYLFHS